MGLFRDKLPRGVSLKEVQLVLKTADNLLGRLPQQEIEAFMASPEFPLYKKILSKLSPEVLSGQKEEPARQEPRLQVKQEPKPQEPAKPVEVQPSKPQPDESLVKIERQLNDFGDKIAKAFEQLASRPPQVQYVMQPAPVLQQPVMQAPQVQPVPQMQPVQQAPKQQPPQPAQIPQQAVQQPPAQPEVKAEPQSKVQFTPQPVQVQPKNIPDMAAIKAMIEKKLKGGV